MILTAEKGKKMKKFFKWIILGCGKMCRWQHIQYRKPGQE